jgi:hypothetical protein
MFTCTLRSRVLVLIALLALLAVGSVSGALAPQTLAATTYCASSADCPSGQLCCYPCGIDGCNRVCMKPMNGHCPFFP